MVTVRPFRALHPPASLAERVAAPPYDVVDLAQARAIGRLEPESFLHVSRPEIDLGPVEGDGAPAAGTVTSGAAGGAAGDAEPGDGAAEPPHDEAAVHRRGRAALEALVQRGSLVRDPDEAVWAYRAERAGRVQTGFAVCVAVDDYDSGAVRTHEHTRPDKEADRTAHVDVLDAHDEPVLLLHRPDEVLRQLAKEACAGPPVLDLHDPDGVRHTLWRVAAPGAVDQVVTAFAGTGHLYVADGHHRSAAASRVRALRRERDGHPGGHGGPDEADAFLAVVFPSDEVTVLPYHRLVLDLGGLSAADVVRRLHPDFAVTEVPGPVEPAERSVFGLYLDGTWYEVRTREDTADLAHPLRGLDVSVLQDNLLAPVLGIADARRDPRLAFLGGVHGVAELQRRVDAGEAAAALTLRATTVQELLTVSDLGEVMPPKSTWFEPKLRSGLLVHPLH